MADVLNGIVVWYKFEDTVTTDSSGNGYTGTLTGSPLPALGTGKFGQGMVFNGPTGGVAVPPAAASVPTATSSWSIMAWLKTTVTDTPIFGGRNSGNGNPIIYLGIGSNNVTNAYTGFATTLVRDTSGAALTHIDASTALNDNNFHHIAIVFDGSGGAGNQTLKLYVDGAQVGSTATVALTTGITFDTAGCNVGREIIASWGTNGTIDDFRIYNRALSATEILNVYLITDSFLLHFDGTQGSTTFTDSYGNHNHQVDGGSPHLDTSQFKFGTSSLYLSTVNDVIGCPSTVVMGTSDFTFDFWIYLNGTQAGQINIWTQGSLILYIPSPGAPLDLYYGGIVGSGTTNVTTNTWHHIAITRQGTTHYVFLDGHLEGTWVNSVDYGTVSPGYPQLGVGTVSPVAWIDEYRMLIGLAAWTSNFTPPTSPYAPPSIGTGTLTITQAAQTISATGNVVVPAGITGTLAITQANQTLSAAGTVRVSGTLALTEVPDTISAAGGPRVGGTLGVTQAAQTLSAAGGPRVGGTLSVTQAAQTLSATGNVVLPVITGTLAVTQANQTLSAAGGPRVGGTLTVTQANQTLSATGAVILVGNLTVTQAAQTLVAAGGPIDGAHLTVTQAAQTLSAAGTIAIGGTLNITQANNTLVAAGGVTVRGTLSVNQAAQTLSATGSVLSGIVGTLSITQANQTLSAAGNVPNVIGGSLHVTQANQTLSATGTVFTGITGTLAITQANQTLAATGTIPIGAITGTLALTQTAQTLSATGTAPGPGIEAMHTLSRGSLYVAGSIKTAAGPVSGLPHPGRVGTRNFVTDATVPLASGVGNIVTGGGSNKVPVYDDGANWRIG